MERKPNIVVFITDQHRQDALGCNNNPIIKTPNIDAIAREGINFRNAYANQPLCLPSRSSMITGLYPSVHRSTINGIPLDNKLPVYPELLRHNGYQTFASGKMHLSPISRSFNIPPDEPGEVPNKLPYYGFEKVAFVEGYKSQYLKMIKSKYPKLYKNACHRHPFEPNGIFQTYAPNPITEDIHRTTWIAENAIKFIEQRNKKKPFLLHCSFWDPHHPFDPPAPFHKMYNPDDMKLPIPMVKNKKSLANCLLKWHKKDHGKDGKAFKEYTIDDWKQMKAYYYGMISLIDKNVGKVMDYLKENALIENTAIFFISDHGEILGDHGIATKGPFHYQGLIKIPLIFSYPAKYPKNKVNNDLVLGYDIMPTILELAGIKPPIKVTAKNLLNKKDGPRDSVLIEAPSVRTIIYKNYRLSVFTDTNEGEIYDLKNDPSETINLWGKDYKLQSMLLHKLSILLVNALEPIKEPIGIW